jgi:hypothetical protein
LTELEKLQRAKMYIDKLADGIDPISDTEMQQDSVLNNVRLSRCFYYVSEILGQVIENGGRVRTIPESEKSDFELPPGKIADITCSNEPLMISRFMERINAAVDSNTMRKLPPTAVTEWMTAHDLLTVVTEAEKNKKIPTASGRQLGLMLETRQGTRGQYDAVLYNENAQRFILEHLEEIIRSHKYKRSEYSKG